eukprot:m.103347 g.103347  ORF g.103347 m.103347 type:complete len:272 (-) comp12613_c3_seq4:2631-3446(-)
MTTLENVDMGSAVTLLQKLFEQAQSDLKHVSRKVEQQFVQDFQHIGNGKVNPRRLLRRLEDLSNKVESLRERSENVKATRQTIATKSVKLSQETEIGLKKLAQLSALDTSNIESTREDVEVLTKCCSEEEGDADTTEASAHSPLYSNPTENPKSNDNNGIGSSSDNSKKRKNNALKFCPITTKEFNSVSQLVRGRAKIDAVNKVYETLHAHFVQAHRRGKFQNVLPLTVKDMTDMGLKITGQTGEAKLKVLRSLQRLTMSRKGVIIKFNED